LRFGQKTPFQEVQLDTAFFFSETPKNVILMLVAATWRIHTFLHLPSQFLSSSAPKKFLQYPAFFFKMFFVFHPDVKSASLFGVIAN